MNFKATRVLALVIATAALMSCVMQPSLEGTWLMTSPDGTTGSVEVSKLAEGEYYFRAPGNPVSGVYALDQSGQLRISKPDLPRMEGSTWQIQKDHTLTLIAEPAFTVSGVRQIASKLTKQKLSRN